jgi:hypothetical protein
MDHNIKRSLRLLLEQHPHVAAWPTSAVISFFQAIGLNQYAPAMDKMCVSGRQLFQATIDSLAAVYCISSFGHRSTIVQALEYCSKHSPAAQPTMHSGPLVSQFAVQDEIDSRTAMRRKQVLRPHSLIAKLYHFASATLQSVTWCRRGRNTRALGTVPRCLLLKHTRNP